MSDSTYRRFALLMIILLAGVGCTATSAPVAPHVENPVATVGAPLDLQIMQEQRSPHELTVTVGLLPTVFIDKELAVVLKMTGFSEGESRAVVDTDDLQPVRYGDIQEALRTRHPIVRNLILPEQNLTDYQLELLWGEEAQRYRTEKARSARLQSPLLIQNLEFEKLTGHCVTMPCTFKFRILGELVNNGDITIASIRLGTGYRWIPANGDPPQDAPLDELEVSLNLPRGMTRALRLTLDRDLQPRSDGRYEPILKILGFSP
jgi:hypothetical protein